MSPSITELPQLTPPVETPLEDPSQTLGIPEKNNPMDRELRPTRAQDEEPPSLFSVIFGTEAPNRASDPSHKARILTSPRKNRIKQETEDPGSRPLQKSSESGAYFPGQPSSSRRLEVPRPAEEMMEKIVKLQMLQSLLSSTRRFANETRSVLYIYLVPFKGEETSFQERLTGSPAWTFETAPWQLTTESEQTLLSVKDVCTALALKQPSLAEVKDLRIMVAPFVKIFRPFFPRFAYDVVSYLLNKDVIGELLEAYPGYPPKLHRFMLQTLKSVHEELYLYFTYSDIRLEKLIFPPMKSIFVNNFTTDDWLSLVDHVLVYSGNFFIYFAIAFLIAHVGKIWTIETDADIQNFKLLKCTSETYEKVLNAAHHMWNALEVSSTGEEQSSD